MGYLEGIDEEDENGNVIKKVDIDEIKKQINKHSHKKKPIFLFIFLNGCGPCNSTKKEWVKIPEHLKNDSDDFLVTAIEQQSFGDLHNVGGMPMGFPTIRHIKGDNEIEEYEGGRTANEFATWIHDKYPVQQGGRVSVVKKRVRRKTRKSRKSRKTGKTKKTRKTKRKGGFLITQTMGINGANVSKTTGRRRYNWTTKKWDYEDCYGIGPLKTCKIRAAK